MSIEERTQGSIPLMRDAVDDHRGTHSAPEAGPADG